MLTTYNVRIRHTADLLLSALVQDGVLTPASHETVTGATGRVYRVIPTTVPVSATGDLHLQVGGARIACHAYALPPEEYTALATHAGAFEQYRVAHLVSPLTTPLDTAGRHAWLRALVDAVQQRPVTDAPPELLVRASTRSAQWLPELTRLVHTRSGWLVCLAFEVGDHSPVYTIKRSAAGIDVGLRTLAVGVHKSGLIHRARGIHELSVTTDDLHRLLPHKPDLWDTAVQLSIALQHAAARAELAQFLELLLASASVVAYEQLRYDDMTAGFKRRVRELGLRDFLAAWMPARLRQAGIEAIAVPPDLTSVYCNTTYRSGQRDRDTFTNVHSDRIDADENAGANIRDLALATLLARQYRRGA